MDTSAPSARDLLVRTLTSAFQVNPDDVTGDAGLIDLGLDSLAVVELIDQLSAQLDRDLPDDALHPAMTVDEAVAVLEEADEADGADEADAG
ncbi:MAG: acyl carrier protein [Streptomyces sp.]|nr:acyl carrier protein [Streptomyces sp.]